MLLNLRHGGRCGNVAFRNNGQCGNGGQCGTHSQRSPGGRQPRARLNNAPGTRGCGTAGGLPLRSGFQVSFTYLSGEVRFGSRTQPSAMPAASLICALCLTKLAMRHRAHISRAARCWHSLVGIRWLRWQSRLAGCYFQRVTLPLRWWHALGCPPQFRPQLPWWQPFVWRWLVLSGWQR